MTYLTCFDSIEVSQIPSGAFCVLGYVDGMWPTAGALRATFPKAHIITLTVLGGDAVADGCDVESGDLTPRQGAQYVARRIAARAWRPVLYASASNMAAVLTELTAAKVQRSQVRLLSAHYTGSAHICASTTCRETSIPMDGTQFTDRALGRNLDESLLLADFFAATPPPLPPPDWQAAMMSKLPTLQQGDTDKAGQPLHVHRVQVLVSGIGRWNALGSVTQLNQDGVFGPSTAGAVKRVQEFFKLTQDGIVGPSTWAALVAG